MPVRPLDTLLALKALNFAADLIENDRRVAATLIEHYNRKTGRCDPSLGRIARLLDINTRTVMRSVARLEAAGLIVKRRHGGQLNRNSYEPVWGKLRELAAVWERRFKGHSNVAGVSPGAGQPCHLDGDTRDTQTYSNINLPNETCSRSHPSKSNVSASIADRRISKFPTTSSSTAMRSAAERRWNDQLVRRFASQPLTFADIVNGIDTAIQEAATDAELARAGAGFTYIMEALGVWTGRASRPTVGSSERR